MGGGEHAQCGRVIRRLCERLLGGSFDEVEQYKPVFDRRFSMLQVRIYDAQANTDREIGAF
jgi:hypothetical protein